MSIKNMRLEVMQFLENKVDDFVDQFLIPVAYIKAKFGAFEIYAGRRKEIFGLVDSTLSSGSYIWSGNALPMPKIQISTPNFVSLPYTKGLSIFSFLQIYEFITQ